MAGLTLDPVRLAALADSCSAAITTARELTQEGVALAPPAEEGR